MTEKYNIKLRMRLLFVFLAILFLEACSSSYQKLSKDNQIPERSFSKYLLESYKAKADFEAKEMHDWNSAKLYSEKALRAIKGENIKPEKISYWKIPMEKIKELEISYNNLMLVYEDAITIDPYNLAIAVSSLDCWFEQQEENWQTWDINKCKEDFLKSMHAIYDKINANSENSIEKENKKSQESVSIVTKNEKNEISQIIYFDFDKSVISEVGLNKISIFLKDNKDKIKKFLIIGHTDTKGSKNYNFNLSLERALSVKKILIQNGVQENLIKVVGRGESDLLIKTDDEIPHPANRRAEISPIN